MHNSVSNRLIFHLSLGVSASMKHLNTCRYFICTVGNKFKAAVNKELFLVLFLILIWSSPDGIMGTRLTYLWYIPPWMDGWQQRIDLFYSCPVVLKLYPPAESLMTLHTSLRGFWDSLWLHMMSPLLCK